MFLDTDNNPIEDNMVTIGKNDSTLTVLLRIFCDGVVQQEILTGSSLWTNRSEMV